MTPENTNVNCLSQPALLIYDEGDKEVSFDESRRLHARWTGSELMGVTGLGHHRIVQDAEVIKTSVAFLKQKLH